MKTVFKQISDAGSKHIAITEAVTLGEILPVFEDFLKGCGFYFDGHVEIGDDYTNVKEEDNDQRKG